MRTRLTPQQQKWKRDLERGIVHPALARVVIYPRSPLLDVASVDLLRSQRYRFKPCIACGATILKIPLPPGRAKCICLECALELFEEPD